jgi:hypothetical protein
MGGDEPKGSFWTTGPGVITAVGGLVSAVAVLVGALYGAGVIGGGSKPSSSPLASTTLSPSSQPPTTGPSPKQTTPTPTAELTDLSGTWQGRLTRLSDSASFLFKVEVNQSGETVDVSFFSQVGGTVPPAPQQTASGAIVNGSVSLTTSEQIGNPPSPFSVTVWTLTLTSPDTLHVTEHESIVDGRDFRLEGDLQKT